VQIVKAVLVLGATIFLTILLMSRFNFSVDALLSAAATASAKGDAFLEPSLYFTNKLDLVSLGLRLALGTAGLPHIMMRFYRSRCACGPANFAFDVVTTHINHSITW
jgi:cation/acetate symporter